MPNLSIKVFQRSSRKHFAGGLPETTARYRAN
jgi:hypothetical protein